MALELLEREKVARPVRRKRVQVQRGRPAERWVAMTLEEAAEKIGAEIEFHEAQVESLRSLGRRVDSQRATGGDG